METLVKELSKEERQANIDNVINYLVTSKREALAEMQVAYEANPRIKEIFIELEKKNEKK